MSITQTAKTIGSTDIAGDPRLSNGTKEFLKALNSPAPPELKLRPAGREGEAVHPVMAPPELVK